MRLSNKPRVCVVFVTALFAACLACDFSQSESDVIAEPKSETEVQSSASGEKGADGIRGNIWWKNEGKIKALDLTPEQLQEIEVIDVEFFEQVKDLRREERRTYARFLSALRENAPDRKHIENSSKAFEDCRARRQHLLVWRLSELRGVLTLDQWTDLKTVAPVVMQVGIFQPVASSKPVFISDQDPGKADPQ